MKFVMAAISLSAAFLLITVPDVVAAATHTGILLCTDVLIPSLYPFMILSLIAVTTPISDVLGILMLPITTFLHLPKGLGGVILTGFVGGFPAGAASLSAMVRQGKLSKSTASQMLPMLINSGPAFAVVAVGERMLKSQTLGWILLFAQLISSLIIGKMLINFKKESINFNKTHLPYDMAMVSAVRECTMSMLLICAYVVLFSVVSALIKGFLPAFGAGIVTGILEVTAGCGYFSAYSGYEAFLPCAFFMGFGGISVISQVKTICAGVEMNTNGLVFYKIISGVLTAIISLFILKMLPQQLMTFSAQEGLIPIYSSNRMLATVCICAMIFSLFPLPAEKGQQI